MSLPFEFSKELVEETLASFWKRSETVQLIGIPLKDVFDHKAEPPPDWVLDPITLFYIPASLLAYLDGPQRHH